MALLENVRFEPGETSKDDAERARSPTGWPRSSARRGRYVDDAFGAVHRKHASVYDVPAGSRRTRATCCSASSGAVPADRPRREPRPYVVVLGGSKVSDKLGVISSLLPKVDWLLVGGGMCFTFLKARGLEVGDSLLEADQIETCRRLLRRDGDKIVLPTDVVVADRRSPRTRETQVVDVDQIPAGRRAWTSAR